MNPLIGLEENDDTAELGVNHDGSTDTGAADRPSNNGHSSGRPGTESGRPLSNDQLERREGVVRPESWAADSLGRDDQLASELAEGSSGSDHGRRSERPNATAPDRPGGRGGETATDESERRKLSFTWSADRSGTLSTYEPGVVEIPSTPRERARVNLEVLELLRILEEENRFATPKEQAMLAQYTSWGGCRDLFDRTLSSWASERDRLHGLVDDRTYNQLREAGLTAFYTAPDVTQAMWGALNEAGLTEGTVLEPGSGIGGFIASAPKTVRMVGVEVDPVAATISRHLYPAETIRNEGFEKTLVADGSFNAVIGNVPFADMRLNDPAHNSGQHSIHNHFIIKSLNLTQPGGYVALLTSAFTADSQRSDARKEMVDRADLISAVRLPSQAFQAVAGTTVISDLLIFRVREPERQPTQKSLDFLKTDVLEIGDKELRVNATLARNVESILGTPTVSTGRFGDPVLNVSGSASGLGERLARVVGRDISMAKAQGLGHTASSSVPAEEFTRRSSSETVLPGTYRHAFDEGDVPQFEQYDSKSGQWNPVAFRGFNDARKREWKQLLGLRDAVVDLRAAYASGTTDQISQSQSILSDRYDTYVAQYGLINRFEAPKPTAPTKKQQDETFRELATEWRLAH